MPVMRRPAMLAERVFPGVAPPPAPVERLAEQVFPERPAEIQQDPFWTMMKPIMEQAGTPGASRILDPGSEAGAMGTQPPPAGFYERLAQLAQFVGNALPGRGGFGDPSGISPFTSLYRGESLSRKPAWRPGDLLNRLSGMWYSSDPKMAKDFVQAPYDRLLEVRVPEHMRQFFTVERRLSPEAREALNVLPDEAAHLLPQWLRHLSRTVPKTPTP